MGEVISINRVSDHDIFSWFDAECPELPENLDKEIQWSAARAVGARSQQKPGSFRTAFVIVAAVSLVGVCIAHYGNRAWVENGFAMSESDAVSESNEVSPGSDMAGNWRQSKSRWQKYIAELENDPHVKRLYKEKRLYRQRYDE